MKCKYIVAACIITVSAVTSVGTAWDGSPLKVVIVHTHRLSVYNDMPDTASSGDGPEADDDDVAK